MKRTAGWWMGLALTAAAGFAHAQAWPSKPIKWVVPFAPGGTTDILARTVGERLVGLGAQPVGNSTEESTAMAKAEVVKRADVVKKSGANVD